MIKTATALVCAAAIAAGAQVLHSQNIWTRNAAPAETYITGGGWTLEQSGAAIGRKSAGYCDQNGNQVKNPGTQRMQPYYFPFITGHGKHLQGYFDYRPKDIDEAVAAAWSDDAGATWTFQQQVLELRTACPNQVQKDPDGDKDNAPDPNNSDNGDDDGQGHQFVMHINGHTYLYTLDRANGHIDSDDLYIHELTPLPGLPLNGAPPLNDGPTDSTSGQHEIPFHTSGLLNPDGILGIVPGSNPLTIIYEQKILNGDTSFPASDRCITGWANYYATNPFGTGDNSDITYLRLASTTDGIHFTDLGALQGLNDPHNVSAEGTRWLATAGTILRYHNGTYGLFFSGGGCIDGDSDAFHYIGYAESADLFHWTVINGLNNPIVSVAPFTLTVDANGLPATSGKTISVPSQPPVAGNTMGWFQGRVYAPSGTIFNEHNLTIIFAGYHTPKPKNGLGDYRTIGRLSLHSAKELGGRDDDDDHHEW
ncbi:MAG: hypothetical protein JOZ83_04050 [Silvibacterium sp.]|nr:hypothetical protein [Silvibacterium sp.]